MEPHEWLDLFVAFFDHFETPNLESVHSVLAGPAMLSTIKMDEQLD